MPASAMCVALLRLSLTLQSVCAVWQLLSHVFLEAGILSMPQLLAKKLCSFGHSAQSTVLNSLHALTMQNKMHIAPSHLVILASPDWFATSWIIQVGCTHNLLCLAFKTLGFLDAQALDPTTGASPDCWAPHPTAGLFTRLLGLHPTTGG